MNILNLVNNRVENYTIILSNRSFQHYGQLTGIKFEDTNGSFNLNSANELSFKVYRHKLIPDENIPYKDIETFQKYIWGNLVDRKLIYIKELEDYYEIKVAIDDTDETIKTVQAKTLCESELSQLKLNNIEINTEDDRATNGETVFYNSENPNASLLQRILKDKAPHYTIKHVDPSLCNLARTFTLGGTSIYDFMVGECSEQFDCLFRFNSKERGIYVYDMLTVCQDCGERGDFTDECPKCESKSLKHFGKDTPIYVDKTNLTDAIHLEVDSDSVKNCFKLEAGDEEMTATVRSLNPNGTDYYFFVSDADKEDMPKELVQKLDEYDKKYQDILPAYQDLTLQIRNLRSDILYYEHSMMPTVEYMDELADVLDPKEGILYICNDIVYLYNGKKLTPSTQDAKFYTDLFPTSSMITAKSEADKLTRENLNPLAINGELTDSTSLTTVNSTLKNYAKVYVKSGYVKLEIENGATFSISEETGLGIWNGRFKVTSYSDEEDIAYSEYLTLEVNDNHNEQMLQKVLKRISENDEENSIFDVLAIDDLGVFKEALSLYSLSRLKSFRDAIDAAKITLFESGQGTEGAELYEPLYLPYQAKLVECENEINARQIKIDSLQAQLDLLTQQQSDIQTSLNLQNYLGDLYSILCSYRREDTYSNSNFVSDGLDNVQMIERAKQFWELAQKEIKKASNGKCTITASLYNLLVIPAFKPLVEYFELGNRIRVKVDSVLYTLMLIGFSLNFGNLNTIEVTFSTATKVKTQRSERMSILESAKQISTSYDYVQKQAEKAKEIDTTMKSIVQNGLDSSLVAIKNNENEEVTQGKFGILLREKDDVTGGYFGKQCRLTHNSMIYTTDGWETAKCALGEHSYTYYNPESSEENKFEQRIAYGLTADFIQANTSIFSPQIIAGELYSRDYNKEDGIGSYISLNGKGKFNFGNLLSFDGEKQKLRITAEVSTGSLLNETEIRSSSFYGGYLLIGDENKEGTYAEITEYGVLNCYGANIYGNIHAIGGSFSGDIESTATISGGTIKGAKLVSDNTNTLYSTIISDGHIYTYGSKNGVSIKTGSIYSFRNGSETTDNYDGFAIVAGSSADAIAFGISNTNDTNFNSYYYLNNGYNPSGHIERHVFFGDERHLGKMYTSSIESSIGYGVITSKYLGVTSSGNLYSEPYRLYCDGNSYITGTSYVNGKSTIGGDCTIVGDGYISGALMVIGTKNRLASTENYNDRLLYCYETPSPMFGDIGEGKIDETGKCYIFLDDIFTETIDTDCVYQVFLQTYGQGECYVTERTSSYFIVEGTINLSFGWEVKAIQRDFDTMRLEEYQETEATQDYAEETYNYLIESLEE